MANLFIRRKPEAAGLKEAWSCERRSDEQGRLWELHLSVGPGCCFRRQLQRCASGVMSRHTSMATQWRRGRTLLSFFVCVESFFAERPPNTQAFTRYVLVEDRIASQSTLS